LHGPPVQVALLLETHYLEGQGRVQKHRTWVLGPFAWCTIVPGQGVHSSGIHTDPGGFKDITHQPNSSETSQTRAWVRVRNCIVEFGHKGTKELLFSRAILKFYHVQVSELVLAQMTSPCTGTMIERVCVLQWYSHHSPVVEQVELVDLCHIGHSLQLYPHQANKEF